MSDYYVYVYCNPSKSDGYLYGQYQFGCEPFYVGKGMGRRINHYKKEYQQSLIVITYKENLSEQEAYALEMDMIKTIGRKDLGKGPLVNKTNGNESRKPEEISTFDQVKKLMDNHDIVFFMETIGAVLNQRKMEQNKPIKYHGGFDGQLIKDRRKLLKCNQRDLSELSGVSVRTIKATESNKGNPTVEILNKILEPIGMALCIKERI